MKLTWINLGLDMALVDERGVILGVLHPLDEQIAMKIRKSLRNDFRRFERVKIIKEESA